MNDQDKITQLKQMIQTAYDALSHAKKLADEFSSKNNYQEAESSHSLKSATLETGSQSSDGRVVEGIFDGLNMIGPSAKQYAVPQNYASKSKLVEGDRLKLTITDDGTFLYKQIGPIERKRLVGVLTNNGEEEYRVLAQGKSYKVILASVTYFKGEAGDEAVILVPKDREASWAAVENIIKRSEQRLTVESDDVLVASHSEATTAANELATPVHQDNYHQQEELDPIEEI